MTELMINQGIVSNNQNYSFQSIYEFLDNEGYSTLVDRVFNCSQKSSIIYCNVI